MTKTTLTNNLYRRRMLILAGAAMVSVAGCLDDDGAEATDEELSEDDDDDEVVVDDDEPDPEPEDDDDEVDEETDVDFVDEHDGQVQLTYGETAHVSNGVRMTAHGLEFYDEIDGEIPEKRDQFAFLHLEAVNTSDEERDLGATINFELLFEDQQVSNIISTLFRGAGLERIKLDDVQGGVRREGHLLFEVNGGLNQSDIDALWQDHAFVAADLDGKIDVRWTDSA